MPAPKRLVLKLDDLSVSAFCLPEMTEKQARNVVCKTCAPRATQMRLVCSMAVYRRDGVCTTYVYECRSCHYQWAIPVPAASYEVQS